LVPRALVGNAKSKFARQIKKERVVEGMEPVHFEQGAIGRKIFLSGDLDALSGLTLHNVPAIPYLGDRFGQ
jgi:hypothetical protein